MQLNKGKLENGKPKPHGEPITDYYPRIITDELYQTVQVARASRSKGSGGPTNSMTNLFKGVATCGCGQKMHYISKSKTDVYLICSAARYGGACKRTHAYKETIDGKITRKDSPATPYKYKPVEELLLNLLAILDYRTIQGDVSDSSSAAIGVIKSKLKQYKAETNNLVTAITGASHPSLLAPLTDKLEKIAQESVVLKSELESHKVHLSTINTNNPNEAFKTLKLETRDERITYNNFIKRFIKRLEFFQDHIRVTFKSNNSQILVNYGVRPHPRMTEAISKAVKKRFGVFRIKDKWDTVEGQIVEYEIK
jgi:hypothetical protein